MGLLRKSGSVARVATLGNSANLHKSEMAAADGGGDIIFLHFQQQQGTQPGNWTILTLPYRDVYYLIPIFYHHRFSYKHHHIHLVRKVVGSCEAELNEDVMLRLCIPTTTRFDEANDSMRKAEISY